MKKKSVVVKKQLGIAIIVVEILVGSFLAILSFLLFLTLASQINSGIYQLDETIMKLVYSFRSAPLTSLMFFISFLGGFSLVFFSFLIFLILVFKRFKHEAFLFLSAFLVGFLINVGLKEYIARNRPEISPLYSEHLFSFPSGHAMNSLVFYLLLAFLIFRITKKRLLTIICGLIAMVLILLIGLSRIYLGVHFPSDVLGGFVAGIWWILTVLVIEKTLRFFSISHKQTNK